MISRFDEYLMRKRAQYNEDTGNVFDDSELQHKFISAFNSGERIRVKFPYGQVKTGTVGVTTGWRPVFILMVSSRSTGSPWILDEHVYFTNEKVTRVRAYIAEAVRS